MTPTRQIRADYDEDTITVYQAYPPEIATRAVEAARSSRRSRWTG